MEESEEESSTVDLRVSDISGVARREARCYRVANSVSTGGGFEKARQAWVECGRAGRSAILMYAQARKTRRRLKIAAAFFKPNSTHCREEALNMVCEH